MKRKSYDATLQAIEKGEFPTINISGEVAWLKADEVCHMVIPECRYGWRLRGTLYVTSKRVSFEYSAGWANWPLTCIVTCKAEDSQFVLVLKDRQDIPHFSTAEPESDMLVVTLIQKLISMAGEGREQQKSARPDVQVSSPKGDNSRTAQKDSQPPGGGALQRVQGKVKWFNNEKGYGFITAQNGKDVFLHYSVVLMDGFKTFQEGDRVEFEIVAGTLGPAASEVTKVGASTQGLPHQDLQRIKGSVKWFESKKGYGFIGSDGAPDVFVHYSSIKMSGFKSLLEGDVVEYSVVKGVNGPMAVRVVKLGEAQTRTRPQESPRIIKGRPFRSRLKVLSSQPTLDERSTLCIV